MLDHIVIEVNNLCTAKEFYLAALKPLDYALFMELEYVLGFAVKGKPDFWVKKGDLTSPHVHIAFRAENRQLVEEFYAAALGAGGKDNGAPGIRERYHANYYGAFVLDPEGHNIEAVCHEKE